MNPVTSLRPHQIRRRIPTPISMQTGEANDRTTTSTTILVTTLMMEIQERSVVKEKRIAPQVQMLTRGCQNPSPNQNQKTSLSKQKRETSW